MTQNLELKVFLEDQIILVEIQMMFIIIQTIETLWAFDM